MARFRKRPVVIDAIRFLGTNVAEVIAFTGYESDESTANPSEEIVIETLEGDMTANVGDWIIKGIVGEVYPCRNDIFEQTYEPVDDDLLTPSLNLLEST